MDNSTFLFTPEDTICAPATPLVNAAIAIIRISGPDSLAAAKNLFSRPDSIQPRTAQYGAIIESDKPLDDVILVYYPSPRSYTGEDMIEIFCHGNQLIVRKIINLLLEKNIRIAEPGEFTRRAFLNGKIDLTEAEAINHIITARSEWEIDAAIRQKHGSLRDIINTLRSNIISLKADIEAGIDFIEEDIEFITSEESLSMAGDILASIESLLLRCRTGEKLSHGIDVAIAGRPNVGKSSILNLMLNQERAIVSEIPGTTRDMIRESIQVEGVRINLIDTAGIDMPGDEIERIGMEISHRNIEKASLVIMVLDSSFGVNEGDIDIIEGIGDKNCIFLINKADISTDSEKEKVRQALGGRGILFSAKTGQGLDLLTRAIADILKNEFIDYEDSFIAEIRVIQLLEKAMQDLRSVRELISTGEPVEIIASELQSVMDRLSEITGEITPDDILDSVFSRFCIGK